MILEMDNDNEYFSAAIKNKKDDDNMVIHEVENKN